MNKDIQRQIAFIVTIDLQLKQYFFIKRREKKVQIEHVRLFAAKCPSAVGYKRVSVCEI